MIPAPMPVPRVTTSVSSIPTAAPAACSASAWQLASLSTIARHPGARDEQLGDRDVLHAPQVRTHVQGAGPVDEPGHPDADRRGVGRERVRQLEEHLHQPVATVGGGHAVLGEDGGRRARVDDDAEDLRPADVEADAEHGAGQ